MKLSHTGVSTDGGDGMQEGNGEPLAPSATVVNAGDESTNVYENPNGSTTAAEHATMRPLSPYPNVWFLLPFHCHTSYPASSFCSYIQLVPFKYIKKNWFHLVYDSKCQQYLHTSYCFSFALTINTRFLQLSHKYYNVIVPDVHNII
jgi:hypothetical protein